MGPAFAVGRNCEVVFAIKLLERRTVTRSTGGDRKQHVVVSRIACAGPIPKELRALSKLKIYALRTALRVRQGL